ncbi:hypothetical protein OLZ31_02460 [Enterobacter asburiae]|nr:hypothetical protein [Enterobacter asburiae]
MKRPESGAEFFAYRIAEAYLYRLMSVHRRPVYRHSAGDIAINTHFIVGLMDNYLAEKMSADRRVRFYSKLLVTIHETLLRNESDDRVIISTGVIPELTPRGIRYLNAMLSTYGDLVLDINKKDSSGKYVIPPGEVYDTNRLHS